MRGVEVTAIDTLMAPYAAEIPYSILGKRGATTYEAGRLEEATGAYRFVVCGNVLDYSDDWMEFLEAAVSRMAPGGELLLSTETRTRPSVGHSQVFTAAQLKRALKWLGLREMRCFRVEPPSNDLSEHLVFVRAGR
jgi:2-polyprenyl-3-methyl-5-hydroxy-6-metoxy-1,4-benzoquinol methylase